jgi:hypothetical protein
MSRTVRRHLCAGPTFQSCPQEAAPVWRLSSSRTGLVPTVPRVRRARHRRRTFQRPGDRAVSCPDHSAESDCCRACRQTGSVQGRPSRSRSDAGGAPDGFRLV